jgi:hypothetical protein
MASPPIPPTLEHLAAQPFSFYPPIVNVPYNEWRFRKATWSEIQVVNCRSGDEIWISRRFVGEVSHTDDPGLIVGLNRELELKGGMVVPFQRRIIQMPVAVNVRASAHGPREERRAPAPVVGIRLEPTDRHVLRLILIAVGGLVGLYVVAIGFTRVGERQKNAVLVGSDQRYLSLNSHEDYLSVTEKLGGPPATDHSEQRGTIFYRALGYPHRRYTVILMGAAQGSLTYIGTMDPNWRPIHSANSQTGALLRALKRF